MKRIFLLSCLANRLLTGHGRRRIANCFQHGVASRGVDITPPVTNRVTSQYTVQYVSALNMSKSCCFAVVLAAICLSVILLSSEADAQPTVGRSSSHSCGAGSSALEEITKDIRRDVKKLLASNTIDVVAGDPSKQALVSALLCKYTSFLQSVATRGHMSPTAVLHKPAIIIMMTFSL